MGLNSQKIMIFLKPFLDFDFRTSSRSGGFNDSSTPVRQNGRFSDPKTSKFCHSLLLILSPPSSRGTKPTGVRIQTPIKAGYKIQCSWPRLGEVAGTLLNPTKLRRGKFKAPDALIASLRLYRDYVE